MKPIKKKKKRGRRRGKREGSPTPRALETGPKSRKWQAEFVKLLLLLPKIRISTCLLQFGRKVKQMLEVKMQEVKSDKINALTSRWC